VRLAVPRLPDAVVKQIASAVAVCIGDIEREDGPALNAHAVALFDTYVEHCGNSALKKVCRDVTDGLAYSLRVPNIVEVLNWADMANSLTALEQATRDRDPIRAELAAEAMHELPGERPLSPDRPRD
jgi:DNA-binding FadR family transcriptional regulator